MTTLLAIDIGNTSTAFGLFNTRTRKRIPLPHTRWRLSTKDIRIQKKLHSVLKKHRSISAVVVSSVVPQIDPVVSKYLRQLLRVKLTFVTSNSKGKIKIRYKKPKEVGSDRIVNARAAIELTKHPSIVIDFGTATTFDCINAKKEYLGGVITPGPAISAEALYKKTAKLPRVLLTKKVPILGQNTLNSIQAGLYHGYRGLVKEILAKLKIKLGKNTKIWVTGGQAEWILKDIRGISRFIPDLTLIGLFLYWKDLQKIK